MGSPQEVRRARNRFLPLIGSDWTPVQDVRARPLSLGLWHLVASGQIQVKTLGVGITLVKRA